MPKVTEEYIKNKKNMIIHAAYNLCIQKNVSTVTMQDIIDATGLSQSGIYKFNKDIDEIFKDNGIEMSCIINHCYKSCSNCIFAL